MARIAPITAGQGGLRVRLAYFFTGRMLAKLAGREPAGDPATAVGLYAYFPGLLSAYGRLEQATGKLGLIDKRIRYLAELKAATMTACEYCMDLGSQIARQSGLSDEKLLAMPHYGPAGHSPSRRRWSWTTPSACAARLPTFRTSCSPRSARTSATPRSSS
jgi:AhpD family alkylhydroperoxidase